MNTNRGRTRAAHFMSAQNGDDDDDGRQRLETSVIADVHAAASAIVEHATPRTDWCCYVLRSVSQPNLMYCGSTNNLRRRLRQHAGLIRGGGKYTAMARPWRLAALVADLPDRAAALAFEAHTKVKNWAAHERARFDRTDPLLRRVQVVLAAAERHGVAPTRIAWLDADLARCHAAMGAA